MAPGQGRARSAQGRALWRQLRPGRHADPAQGRRGRSRGAILRPFPAQPL